MILDDSWRNIHANICLRNCKAYVLLPPLCCRTDRLAICPSSCAELIRRSTWLNEAGSGRKCWEVCVFDLFKMVINVIGCVCGGRQRTSETITSCWADRLITPVFWNGLRPTLRNAEPRQPKAFGATSFSLCLFHTFSAQWKLNGHYQKSRRSQWHDTQFLA